MGIRIITSGSGGGGAGYSLSDFRTDHRVAYYDCADDGTAGLQDSEGTNHLTENATSVATFGNTGVNGNCIGLTGNNDRFYLQSANICPSATEEWVLSMWVKPDSTSRRIFTGFSLTHPADNNPRISFAIDGSDLLRCVINGAITFTLHAGSGVNLGDGNFHHVLFMLRRRVDGEFNMTAYIDGFAVGDVVYNISSNFSNGFFYIGRISFDSVMTGLIDEVEIFKSATCASNLSQTVIDEMVAEY